MTISTKKRWVPAVLVFVTASIVYLALPFALSPLLAQCYPSRTAQSIMAIAYPFLRIRNDNSYKRYWLAHFNERVRRADTSCPDRNSRIDAP
jgi:predicted membrane chloride channel (bestrophin family)